MESVAAFKASLFAMLLRMSSQCCADSAVSRQRGGSCACESDLCATLPTVRSEFVPLLTVSFVAHRLNHLLNFVTINNIGVVAPLYSNLMYFTRCVAAVDLLVAHYDNAMRQLDVRTWSNLSLPCSFADLNHYSRRRLPSCAPPWHPCSLPNTSRHKPSCCATPLLTTFSLTRSLPRWCTLVCRK